MHSPCVVRWCLRSTVVIAGVLLGYLWNWGGGAGSVLGCSGGVGVVLLSAAVPDAGEGVRIESSVGDVMCVDVLVWRRHDWLLDQQANMRSC